MNPLAQSLFGLGTEAARNLQRELAEANAGLPMPELTPEEVDDLAARYEAERQLHEELGREEEVPPLRDPMYLSAISKCQILNFPKQ